MKKISILITLFCAMICLPHVVFGGPNAYLPESSGIELDWVFTETPPKRPQPKLLNSNAYETKWKIDNELMLDLVQDKNGVLYTTDADNIVQAVYPNGREKWTVQLDSELSVIDLILGQDGTIYAYSTDELIFSGERFTSIYALSPEGDIQWNIQQATSIYSKFDYHFAGDSHGNFVYFTDKGLVSRNAKGEINWVKEDITSSSSSVLSRSHSAKVFIDSQGNIYVDTAKKEIVSLDSKGSIRWRSEPQNFLNDFSVFHPFFSDGGLLYMLTEEGLHALNANDGSAVTITNSSDLRDIRSSGIPTDGKGGYYVEIRGAIQKIDYKGELIWRYITRSTEKYGVGYLDPLPTDELGNVYFPTGVGNIIGLNSAGQEMFAFLRNAFWHKIINLVVGKNGNIYSTNHEIGLVAFGPKRIQVYLDNLPIPMTAAPIKNNGTVLVPFRALFENLGLKVTWNPESKTIAGSKEGLLIQLAVGSKTAYVNGQAKQLTEAPIIKNNISYVPLRFVGEALGKTVSWDKQSSSVNIDSR